MPKISKEKREARRLEILDVAARCFARQGFHRTSMEDIVRESKSSPGAIYCYFRSKNDIIAAIADQRHNRESALVAELLTSNNVSEGLQHLARSFFEMLQDAKERERRKVTIQIWAESLRDKRIRKIVERGIRQRDVLTASLRSAQRAGQLPKNLDTDAFSRVLLALLQGFILQQAWEPALDTEAYLATVSRLINSVFSEAGGTRRAVG
ncbi:MAG TPA: TetR/AcrR family transcriptional regulator [Acidobacteriaceae bacterium]|jgi:AcrR family transcriptional regulator|nr:TetR/AcrR family transcriptional regulator [Acidobacteriaceae bacterium]